MYGAPRSTAFAAFALAVAAFAAPVIAQPFPARPITIVIGYTPGAVSDLVARTIGEGLHQAWGQPVIVDNRPGSSGNIGAAFVARAPADGYTLMVGTDATMASNVHLFKQVGFDPVKDFAPVTLAGANIVCLAVNADLPVKSVAELIAYAKTHPGKLSFGSSGVGSPHHLAGELLRQMAGIEITHVPYKGGGPAMNDVLGGHIPMAFLSLSAVVPHINTNRVRILAVVEKSRYAAMPEVPTIAETVPGFEMSSWIGVFAPAGTPSEIVARLNDGMVKVLTTESVKARLATLGLAVIAGTPDELGAVVKDGIKLRGELVKAAGIQPE
jgi:tripartite-type tricarboxylate transporter receptor subunit TctC